MPIKLYHPRFELQLSDQLVDLERSLFSGSTDIESDIIFSRFEIFGRPRKLHKS
jgi:hypothetical protein